jgi:hypothetical protein
LYLHHVLMLLKTKDLDPDNNNYDPAKSSGSTTLSKLQYCISAIAQSLWQSPELGGGQLEMLPLFPLLCQLLHQVAVFSAGLVQLPRLLIYHLQPAGLYIYLIPNATFAPLAKQLENAIMLFSFRDFP